MRSSRKVKELCTLIVDCVNKTAPKVDSPTSFKMIRTTNIKGGRLDTKNCNFVSEETFIKWTRRATLEPKDILLTREAPIGEVAQVKRGTGLFLGQRIMQYRPNPKEVDPDYLFFTFLSPILKEQFGMHEGSGSTVSHIRVGDCSEFDIPCPTIHEQRKISAVLRALFDYEEALSEQNDTLESIAQTLFKSWFVNFDPVHAKAGGCEPEGLSAEIAALFPSEFEESELGTIPKGWVIKSFGECLTSTIGGDWGSETAKSESDIQAKIIRGTDIPALRSSNSDKVPTRHIKASKFGQRQLRMGDLVIEVSGGSTDQSTGRSLRVTPSMLSHLGNSVAPTSFCRLFRPQAGFSELLALRLDYLYDSGAMWSYQVQSTGIANFQTQLFLEKEKFAVPPAPLLKKFSDLVSPMIENTFDERVVVLKNLRDELLPRLISGKIRIEEAEEALADVVPSTEKQVA